MKFKNQVGNEVTFQVPLAGFGKAFDGAPLDPQVLAEQQKKLQDEFQKRSDELRAKFQGGSAAAAPDQAAPVAPKPWSGPFDEKPKYVGDRLAFPRFDWQRMPAENGSPLPGLFASFASPHSARPTSPCRRRHGPAGRFLDLGMADGIAEVSGTRFCSDT